MNHLFILATFTSRRGAFGFVIIPSKFAPINPFPNPSNCESVMRDY